jgi:hypothetical protein
MAADVGVRVPLTPTYEIRSSFLRKQESNLNTSREAHKIFMLSAETIGVDA